MSIYERPLSGFRHLEFNFNRNCDTGAHIDMKNCNQNEALDKKFDNKIWPNAFQTRMAGGRSFSEHSRKNIHKISFAVN